MNTQSVNNNCGGSQRYITDKQRELAATMYRGQIRCNSCGRLLYVKVGAVYTPNHREAR